ncbi:hypothetical protein CA11_26030 [Gimesia maris]|jgi:hypothetical protein|nr:hypothetical protein Mal35_27150 [Gimesia maris]QDU14793.1 hypothetical protein CA11_26030 [Gimesia maris]
METVEGRERNSHPTALRYTSIVSEGPEFPPVD